MPWLHKENQSWLNTNMLWLSSPFHFLFLERCNECKESKPMELLEVLSPVRWCFSDGVLYTYWFCSYPGLRYMVFFTLPSAATWSSSDFVVLGKHTYILTQSSKILKSYISLSVQRDYYYSLLFIVSLFFVNYNNREIN